MALVRLIGTWLLIASALVLIGDAAEAYSTGHTLTFTPLVALAKALAPKSIEALQTALSGAQPALGPAFARFLLGLPAAGVFAVSGILMLYVGRRQRRPQIFAN